MGVLYTVVPLNDEVAEYLRDTGGIVPPTEQPSRQPTPLEIRAVCDSLPGQRVRYNVNSGAFWQAMVEGTGDREREPWTLLNISKFSGSEDKPHPIWFEKGWPCLILAILRGLTVNCGPLVVIPDTGEAPVAVTAGDTVEELLARWEHTLPVEGCGDPACD